MTAFSARILLIEDDDAKRQTVLSSIHRELEKIGINGIFSHANSVQSAISQLSMASFDLIIADMSLPTFDVKEREAGGSPRPLGGLEVFDYLERCEIEIPTIVITSYPVISDGSTSMKFDDLGKKLSDEFPGIFVGSIYYDSTYTDWDSKLNPMLQQIFKAKK